MTWSPVVLFVTSIVLGLANASPLSGQQLVLNTRCNAATCHGGISGDTWRTSHNVWQARDPHATAGVTLKSSTSTQIVNALKTSDEDAETTLRERCFSCHVTHVAADFSTAIQYGVSCQSCHGPASKWQEHHMHSKRARNLEDGLTDNQNWLTRMELCSKCHIGNLREDGLVRDVNHDLIAAGHPALAFDPLTYHKALDEHAHWDESEAIVGKPNYQMYEVGRHISLAASAELARQRIATNAPSPELSEYDCFACHHDLRSATKPDSKEGIVLPQTTGFPTWNPWYTTGIANGLKHYPGFEPNSTVRKLDLKQLSGLRKRAHSIARRLWREPAALPERYLELLRQLASRDQFVDRRRREPVLTPGTLLTTLKYDPQQAQADWYQAVDWHSRLKALQHDAEAIGIRDRPFAIAKEVIEKIDMQIQFPTCDNAAFNSPANFDPKKLQEQLKFLRTALQESEKQP